METFFKVNKPETYSNSDRIMILNEKSAYTKNIFFLEKLIWNLNLEIYYLKLYTSLNYIPQDTVLVILDLHSHNLVQESYHSG